MWYGMAPSKAYAEALNPSMMVYEGETLGDPWVNYIVHSTQSMMTLIIYKNKRDMFYPCYMGTQQEGSCLQARL